MVEDVLRVALPVAEELVIRRNRLVPSGDKAKGTDPAGNSTTKRLPRIAVVTGTHGDELEGQYVCALLAHQIQENLDQLHGVVDIYPALNPLGIDTIERGVPYLDVDMNRYFAGEQDRHDSYIAHLTDGIAESLLGADLVVDIHSSNIYLREIPQIRMTAASAPGLLPYARLMNVEFIWIHEAVTVLKSTLAHTLNSRGTPTLVVEMGVGMRVTPTFCRELVRGVFRVMMELGIWEAEHTPEVRSPIESGQGEVTYLNSPTAGLFVPEVEHWIGVGAGQLLGRILSPLSGEVLSEIFSPSDGTVFTLREYPVVMEGSLLARIYTGPRTQPFPSAEGAGSLKHLRSEVSV